MSTLISYIIFGTFTFILLSWPFWIHFLIIFSIQPQGLPIPGLANYITKIYNGYPRIYVSYFCFIFLLILICKFLLTRKSCKIYERDILKIKGALWFLFYGPPVFLLFAYATKLNVLIRLVTSSVKTGIFTGFAEFLKSYSGFIISADIVFVCLFIFNGFKKQGLRGKIEKSKITYPKFLNQEKFYKKGIKNNLGEYLGYNLGVKNNEGKYFENALPGPVYLTEAQRLRHTHIVGTTGSGKTTGVIFPLLEQDIIKGRGLIFIDAKGDLDNAKAIYKIAKESDREQDFLLFSIAHPQFSHTYNPLQYGDPTQLKDKITGAIEWSEPFYQRICENALQILFMEHGNNPITLKGLYSILQNPSSKYYEFSKIREQHQRNIQTLENEVGILINTTFGELLQEPKGEIDLFDAYKNKKIVYFALDTQSYGATAMRLGKMITQDLITLSGIIQSEISERNRQAFGIFIDEFQAFGTKNFISCLARGRASGFMITIAHQSIGDLNAIDIAYRQQVGQNTNTKIFLQSNDPDTIREFADALGTYEAIGETHQVVYAGMPTSSEMGTEKLEPKYYINPQTVRELQDFEAVYKYQMNFGKLILYPLFIDTKDLSLPVIKRPPRTQEIGQGELQKEPTQPPESVF